ncbi:MAG: AAA family ATPase [Candidatus Hydrogenedentes bacterium]|nr:AAA family ATPase [Candidatus Hydrogenedentota bacterium]
MRIRKISIDGYGRFINKNIEVGPGFHVLIGPNEQGKSTLRCFISDMLYGQKRSANLRAFEDSNELRCPWSNPETYGGRLVYVLDNGREIEVFRNFDKKNESLHVFDLTHACEITNDFEPLKNRERMFAQTHLGISKEVFLNTATIGHSSLEALGDADALDQIREKLLALADTGEETTSADAVLKRLEGRIGQIGQPAARTRPLPAARIRFAELNSEYERAQTLQQDLQQDEARRQQVIEEVGRLRRDLAGIGGELAALEKVERAERLRQADLLAQRIDESTRRLFELREAENFPLHLCPEFQRAELMCSTARNQFERLRQEYDRRKTEIASDLEQLAGNAGEISEEFDARLAAIEEKARGLRVRQEETQLALAGSEQRLATAELELQSLPDFSRLADDPMAWLSQLSTSFRVAQRHRDEMVDRAREHRAKVDQRNSLISSYDHLFAKFPDFENAAREYELRLRVREEQLAQLENALEIIQASADQHVDQAPDLRRLAIVCGALVAALSTVGYLMHNSGVFIAAAFALLGSFYFLSKWATARSRAAKAVKQLKDTEARIIELRDTEDEHCARMERRMVAASCQTIRELEARYDVYRKGRMELDAAIEAGAELESRALDASMRVAQMFDQYRVKLTDAGEPVSSEYDIEDAANRALGRYQTYRDAKRRVAENREQAVRHRASLDQVLAEVESVRREDVETGLAVRQLMRDAGYAEESRHDSALAALRSYRIRSAQSREKRRVLQQNLDEIAARVADEEEELKKSAKTIAEFLVGAGLDSVPQWHDRARQAEEYREMRRRLDALNEQLGAVLRGQDLRDLRAAVLDDGPVGDAARSSADELKRRRDAVSDEIDARVKEEHSLHLEITHRAGSARSLSEIEEERAVVEAQIRDLSLELDAAGYAMALIEEIARDKHSRIAPRLTSRASEYLAHITGDAYRDLLVSREMRVSVRIPQTQRMNEEPEKILSKGTIDQVFFALRIAMVQCIGETGETIPMLLDDPFPNYDDDRLLRAMKLLDRVGQTNQVLLFTCRDDVVRAAQTLQAPILRL